MAFLHTRNVRIAGVAASVPSQIERNEDVALNLESYNNEAFITETGVIERRLSTSDKTTADYCTAAAEQLISDLQWDRSSIDAVIFVSQTPDYIYPATACIIQERLCLSKECYALDISLGCSGWVYGLSTVAALLNGGQLKRALLLAGDVHAITRVSDAKKLPSYLLFGDAGTATAVEFAEDARGFNFHFGTDGSGADAIILPMGGMREKYDLATAQKETVVDGIAIPQSQIQMKGMDVFAFGISAPAKSIKKLAKHCAFDYKQQDYIIFHQANIKMLEILRNKLKLRSEQVPYSIEYFGNTSSASIPLTMVTQLRNVLPHARKQVLCSGFGVGLSWGTVALDMNETLVSQLVEL